MGWRAKDAAKARDAAVSRGGKSRPEGDFLVDGKPQPAIFGIGDSLIYFVDTYGKTDTWTRRGFVKLEQPELVADKGFLALDHLTNNVEKGTMGTLGQLLQARSSASRRCATSTFAARRRA